MDSLVFGILVSIQKIFVRSESQCPDFRAFKIADAQTIMRSKLHMSRLSCVQNCICPDYRAFIFFSRPCIFERTTSPCAFISVWAYRLSVWDLNLGYITITYFSACFYVGLLLLRLALRSPV